MPVDDPNVVKQLEAPVPWIGLYAAAASTICTLAMAADVLRGLGSRKYWFPSKYFSLNATSLTLLAVAMKLPVDLTTKMYSATDRLAKVSSIAFMAITMANFLTSLGSMADKSVLMNVVALGILVITIAGNVCIQIIQMRSFLKSRRALWEESLAMALMLVLLFMFISSALTISSTKQQLKTMYHDRHKSAKNEGQLVDVGGATASTKKLKLMIRKYWVMAETSSPQFVIARSVTSTVFGIMSLLVALILVEAEMRIAIKEGIFDQTYSSYKRSTRGILLTQTIGVIVGAIAPISRWFVAINYSTSPECRMNNTNAFTVESYWTEKLVEWRQSSLSVEIRHLKSRKALHDLKGLVVKLCISVQHFIVLASKLVLAVSIWITRSIKSSLHYVRISDPNSEDSTTKAQVDNRRYVIQLEGEVELPAETLRNIFKEVDEIIKKGKTRKPEKLLELLHKSCNFNGVKEFDSHQVPSLHPQELPYCWSLPVVTLACIALAIPNVEKDRSKCLVRSVTEGLRYVNLIDNLADKKGQLAKTRAAADEVSVGAELRRKWLDKSLDDLAVGGQNADQVLQHLIEDSQRKVLKFKKDPRYWPPKVIAANSMYRVGKTVLLGKGGKTDKELFEKLSTMIADIVAACLTNLPRAITKMCHRNAIEKREKGVRNAALYLGETQEIIALLQERQLPPILTTKKAACIEEWRLKYNQEAVSWPEPTADHVTINVEDDCSCG